MRYIFVAFLCAVMGACREGAHKRTIFTTEAPVPIGPYSQAVRSGDLLFVSGQIALDKQGQLDSSCIENECRQVMENIQSILLAADLEMKDVCKCSIYTTDLKNFKAINEVYSAYFSGARPARETVQVAALPKNAHVEISVIAQYRRTR